VLIENLNFLSDALGWRREEASILAGEFTKGMGSHVIIFSFQIVGD
jgi:hypothetical protein